MIAWPVSPTTAFQIGEKADDPLEMYLTDIFTLEPEPGRHVRHQRAVRLDDKGLPIGLQLIGPFLGEETILRTAHAYEQSVAWRERQPALEGIA